MATVDRFKGADIPIVIGLTDDDDAAINIDVLSELYVFVVLTSSGTVAAKFNKAGSTGYNTLRKSTTTSYIADWLSGSTKVATSGDYHIEVNIVESDANYEDSLKNSLASDDIIYLKELKIKSVSSG